MAINQIAKIGLSSLQVIYYFEILFIFNRRKITVVCYTKLWMIIVQFYGVSE
ncbi:hypothetical protein XNC3_1580003 [Xenorhabdus nematophila F1]|nr:hypothetical protein XNC3_1580003 [Xenorhabdus nematophila F1]